MLKVTEIWGRKLSVFDYPQGKRGFLCPDFFFFTFNLCPLSRALSLDTSGSVFFTAPPRQILIIIDNVSLSFLFSKPSIPRPLSLSSYANCSSKQNTFHILHINILLLVWVSFCGVLFLILFFNFPLLEE